MREECRLGNEIGSNGILVDVGGVGLVIVRVRNSVVYVAALPDIHLAP